MSIQSKLDITLHLAKWQVTYAKKWIKNSDVRLAPVEIPFASTSNGRMDWTENALVDTKFDFLVSDNLMEAIMFHEKIALVGSFLWDTHENSFQQDSLWLKINQMRTPIFGSELFAMPPVKELSGFQAVGLIGKCEEYASCGDKILFSFGTSEVAKELCNLVQDKISSEGKLLDGIIFDDVVKCKPAGDHSKEFFSSISSAVIRPGIGSVSDCLRYGVPMVILHEDWNKEMKWNTKVLVENGLATVANTADEALTKARNWNNKSRRSEFHKKRQDLRWEGEKEIAAGILYLLEENR